MSDTDRAFADATAQTVVDRLLSAVKDPKTAEEVLGVWSGEIDRTIGRGLRRLGFYVLLAVIGIASAKLGLLDKLGAFLVGKP